MADEEGRESLHDSFLNDCTIFCWGALSLLASQNVVAVVSVSPLTLSLCDNRIKCEQPNDRQTARDTEKQEPSIEWMEKA